MTSLFNGQNLVAQGRWGGVDTKNGKGGKVTQNTTPAAGLYDLTLEQGLALNEYVVQVIPESANSGAVGVIPSVIDLTKTVKQVLLKDVTNANINANFQWSVFQLPGT